MRSNPPGVIWITGFSASGKTTVGRKLELMLRSNGQQTIFLDGDDLRSILAGRWGYERHERVDLARVYFRLCSHLAAQGFTVVIAAVAMYQEVFDWVQQNVPHALTALLNVPEQERRRRDAVTKKIYGEVGDTASLYDEPQGVDLRIDNFGGVSPDEVAAEIMRTYLLQRTGPADLGRTTYWGDYYNTQHPPLDPSPFARVVAQELDRAVRLLEIGCGNGRDAAFFVRCGHDVTALDASDAAVDLCQRIHGDLPITFFVGRLPDVRPRLEPGFDVVYARFVLHAMTVQEETAMLTAAHGLLRSGGRLYVECRSINDPLAREGEVISATERIHGHYRRFIVLDELRARLRTAGFDVGFELESKGLATQGEEDPVVIRVTAERPHVA